MAHILIRDGAKDVSLRYLAEQPRYFATSHISSGKFFLRSFFPFLYWVLTRGLNSYSVRTRRKYSRLFTIFTSSSSNVEGIEVRLRFTETEW